MTDRIIFIDIDGVLIPFGGADGNSYGKPSPQAAAVLKQAKADGWKLVLHSTWRHDRLAEAYQLFEGAEIPLDGHVDVDEPSKVRAINDYLLDNYADGPPRFLIVDDDELPDYYGGRHIRPDFRIGLTSLEISR